MIQPIAVLRLRPFAVTIHKISLFILIEQQREYVYMTQVIITDFDRFR